MTTRQRAKKAQAVLKSLYADTGPHLAHRNAWELLVATVLAAQCTDARVNKVTPVLFLRYPAPADIADAVQADLEEIIRSTGFYHNKAKHLIAAARRLVDDFGGVVPRTIRELTTLEGVARKTANVVLAGAFGINEGLAVDTHVGRIALRLGFTKSIDPAVTERDLLPLFPREEWGNVNHRMVSYGRDYCRARLPHCAREDAAEPCPMSEFCPRIGVNVKKASPIRPAESKKR